MTKQFLPTPSQHGGTQLGSTYLADWTKCPRRWFYRNLFPYEGQEGMVPDYAKRPLLQGSLFHTGMAAWLESGVRDGQDTGQYDLDAARAAISAETTNQIDHWPNPEDMERDFEAAMHLMDQYHRYFGPEGYAPQYPEIQVLCDDKGLPLIEREITVPLGYRDYVYTCRADAIIQYGTYVAVLEHKTSAGGFWVDNRLQSAHHDAQIDGELYALRHAFPNQPKMGCLLNVVIKGWEYKKNSRNPQPAVRDFVNRTQAQLDRFRVRAVQILQDIDARVLEFRASSQSLNGGGEVEGIFPSYGLHTGACFEYRSECPFMQPCKLSDTRGSLAGFRPRSSLTTPASGDDESNKNGS